MIVLSGITVLIATAVLFSTDRKAINVLIVSRAFILQATLGALLLFVPAGRSAIEFLSEGVLAIIGFSSAGIEMVFGDLAGANAGFSFAIRVLPVIIFFSALMSVLYHLRVMQWVILLVGGGLQRIIGTSRVESLNAAANVFVGLTEAPLVIRPLLGKLTNPQLFCIMVSGMASVAGTVLAAYAQMGVRMDYLLTASLMAAPGGLVMAKLVMPDRPGQGVADSHVTAAPGFARQDNIVLAAAKGASDGLLLAVNIGAMLIAFVSLIALFNGLVGGAAGLVGIEGLTVEKILGTAFAPLMYLLGVPGGETAIAGALFGEKLVLNEFVAFVHLAEVIETLSPRTQAVVTFSLCGFANFSAIAVLLGGLGRLVPTKRVLIGRYGLRVVLAGSLSNLMSAAIVSLLLGS